MKREQWSGWLEVVKVREMTEKGKYKEARG